LYQTETSDVKEMAVGIYMKGTKNVTLLTIDRKLANAEQKSIMLFGDFSE
jgi:hypothetical protein